LQDVCNEKQKRPENQSVKIVFVELEGFEPSSKQAIHKISTCLFCYWFSTESREQTPNFQLIFLGFRVLAEASKTLFPHSYISEPNAAEQSICEISCFLTKIFGKTLDLLYFDIKLQERTLRCQLKFCSKGFKRSRYGSLHAYLSIGLAVETSQPHKKVNKYITFFITE